MQNSPAAHTNDIVRVRRLPWRIVDIRAYDTCHVVTLRGIGPANAGLERRIVAPFDVIDRVELSRRAKFVRLRTWRRVCRGLIAGHVPPGGLRSVRRARLDLLAHQLEPALAIVRGLGSRVLLADDVGLGKTIQAGLIVSELRARGAADRVLILTPSGLREQWAGELRQRLDIAASIIDAGSVRRLVSTLPVGVNPWSTQPLVIASIDYVKRPEVLPGVLACAWDVVIVDEAHGAVGESDRHGAVAALASTAGYVVLLTATPHSGDRSAFLSLCGTGAVAGDSLLVFRRTRKDVHLGIVRRVHLLTIRPSGPELRMHDLLRTFTQSVRRDHGDRASLALSVLHKRALSSARSLERSVARRLLTLSGDGGRFDQLMLPMDDASGELSAADEAPAWPAEMSLQNVQLERRLLQALATAAAEAARAETKVSALRRLIRRIGEPVVVFTEYRDTLTHLERYLERPALLHGGLTAAERTTALDAFTNRTTSVLLATDAAGSGLNLHHACRVVINLELPWNPMRLEQRIGRVDRIGQRRTVHAFHLVAGGTGEVGILNRLRARVARARIDFDAPDPLGEDAERSSRRLVINGLDVDDSLPIAAPFLISSEPRLVALASAEAARVSAARQLAEPAEEDVPARFESGGPIVSIARSAATRARLAGGALLVWRVSQEDGCGRVAESLLVPLAFRWTFGRRHIDRHIREIDPELRRYVDAATIRWREQAEEHNARFAESRLRREKAIVDATGAHTPPPFQSGLFDRRSDRVYIATISADENERAERERRLALIEQSAAAIAVPPRLLLVLLP